MDTEGLKIQFFKQEVERGIRDIFEAQRMIAQSGTYQRGASREIHQRRGGGLGQRTGNLLRALSTPSYSISQAGQGVVAHTNVPMYIRFLDMKRKGNWKIYNRQIWGIMYHDVRARIRYEFQDFLEAQRKKLQASLQNEKGEKVSLF